MSNLLTTIIIMICILSGTYVLGRIFTKGVLYEIDTYITNKFNKHSKTKNQENGTESEKKE